MEAVEVVKKENSSASFFMCDVSNFPGVDSSAKGPACTATNPKVTSPASVSIPTSDQGNESVSKSFRKSKDNVDRFPINRQLPPRHFTSHTHRRRPTHEAQHIALSTFLESEAEASIIEAMEFRDRIREGEQKQKVEDWVNLLNRGSVPEKEMSQHSVVEKNSPNIDGFQGHETKLSSSSSNRHLLNRQTKNEPSTRHLVRQASSNITSFTSPGSATSHPTTLAGLVDKFQGQGSTRRLLGTTGHRNASSNENISSIAPGTPKSSTDYLYLHAEKLFGDDIKITSRLPNKVGGLRRRAGLNKNDGDDLDKVEAQEDVGGVDADTDPEDMNQTTNLPRKRWVMLKGAVNMMQKTSTNKEHEEERDNKGGSVEVESVRNIAVGYGGTEGDAVRVLTSSSSLLDYVDSGRPRFGDRRKAANHFFQCKRKFFSHLRIMLFLIIIPLTGIAAILFYLVGNPLVVSRDGNSDVPIASYSWLLLFFARQAITFHIARVTQFIFIDLFSLKTRVSLKIFGPTVTLIMVQSRGWPYLVMVWALWDFSLLYGKHVFANHWLFWQDTILMFAEDNPNGQLLSNPFYRSILIAMIVVGTLTSLKRTIVSICLGKRTCEFYRSKLEKLMHEMLLVSEVANLSWEIQESATSNRGFYTVSKRNLTSKVKTTATKHGLLSPWKVKDLTKSRDLKNELNDSEDNDEDEDDSVEYIWNKGDSGQPPSQSQHVPRSIRELHKSGHDQQQKVTEEPKSLFCPLDSSGKIKLVKLLDAWEEPENREEKHSNVTLNELLEFRLALSYLETSIPFSTDFGLADNRKNCCNSAEEVYQRLLMINPTKQVVNFETISTLALDSNDELNEKKMKSLIRLFRPDRDGNLTLLYFVKSCDSVYRKLRLFRAAIANSSALNNAYEKIINSVFYFALGMLVLVILHFDPWTLLLSLSTIILSFAFAFGSAASKYFEGILLITIRMPFNIGDRIAISNSENDTSPNGSSTWYVEDVTLFHTTLRYATTNEVSTIANGTLANSRIINGARSPNALLYIYMKFGLGVSYEKVQLFGSTARSFVKTRPREWANMSGFRATRVEHDLGYIEYVIVVQHRESWQNVSTILNSKANLSSFCLEVSKMLDMRYQSPPLPIEINDKGYMDRNIMDTTKNNSVEETTQPSHKETFSAQEKDFIKMNAETLKTMNSLFTPSKRKSMTDLFSSSKRK